MSATDWLKVLAVAAVCAALLAAIKRAPAPQPRHRRKPN